MSGNPYPVKLLYMDRPVEELTREELIEACYSIASELESTRRAMRADWEMQKLFRAARPS